jgi:hypothetical protein
MYFTTTSSICKAIIQQKPTNKRYLLHRRTTFTNVLVTGNAVHCGKREMQCNMGTEDMHCTVGLPRDRSDTRVSQWHNCTTNSTV